MWLLSVFFRLSWLSIDTSVSTLEKNPTVPNFFGVWLIKKAWEISCQLVRTWDMLWHHEIHHKVMRLGKSEWKNQTNHSTWEWDLWLVCCSAYTPCTCDFENVVFISRMYILVVQRSGELDEMLTPLPLILQLHFHLWYLIFTRATSTPTTHCLWKPAFSL